MEIVQPGTTGSRIFQTLPARGKLLQRIPQATRLLRQRVESITPAPGKRSVACQGNSKYESPEAARLRPSAFTGPVTKAAPPRTPRRFCPDSAVEAATRSCRDLLWQLEFIGDLVSAIYQTRSAVCSKRWSSRFTKVTPNRGGGYDNAGKAPLCFVPASNGEFGGLTAAASNRSFPTQ